jgi:hypothetical protein
VIVALHRAMLLCQTASRQIAANPHPAAPKTADPPRSKWFKAVVVTFKADIRQATAGLCGFSPIQPVRIAIRQPE